MSKEVINSNIHIKATIVLADFFFFYLDLAESGPYHQKAPLNPPAIVFNDMLQCNNTQ